MIATAKHKFPTMRITETAVTITSAALSFWNSEVQWLETEMNLHIYCNAWFVWCRQLSLSKHVLLLWCRQALTIFLCCLPLSPCLWLPVTEYSNKYYFVLHNNPCCISCILVLFTQYYTTSHSPIWLLPSIALLWILVTETQIKNRKIHIA